nr:hypothetical protein [Thioalkalivibrio denitrificans]
MLGGPMGVHEDKRFVHNIIERGTPVLGLCLGARLIADVLGTRVEPNRFRQSEDRSFV